VKSDATWFCYPALPLALALGGTAARASAVVIGPSNAVTGIDGLVVLLQNGVDATYNITLFARSYSGAYATNVPIFLGDFNDSEAATSEIGVALTNAGTTGLIGPNTNPYSAGLHYRQLRTSLT
jgi:hypothetical protein